LAGQIHGQRIACLFFRALEEFFDLRFGEFGGKDAVLEAVVVEDVGVAGGEDYAEAVIADGPGSMLAAGTAAEVGACQ